MRKKMRILSVIMMLIIMITGGAFSIAAETAAHAQAPTGGAGGVSYIYDQDTKRLTVLSDDAMAEEPVPWFDFRDEILEVVIEDSVTMIGKSAFQDHVSLKSVAIPAGVNFIKAYAFRGSAIETIHYCGTEEEWTEVFKDVKWNFGMGAVKISFHEGWISKDELYHERECDYCDQFEEHDWDDGVVISAPDHFTEGTKRLTCKDCSATKDVSIDKVSDHVYEYESLNGLQHKKFCACGNGTASNEDHKWDEGVITVAATHTAVGTRTYTCICGETKTEDVPKTIEHHWVKDEENSVAPTHTESGEDVFVCECQETKTEEVSPLGHEYNESITLNGDVHKNICACGHEEEIPHDWIEGNVIDDPTHTVEGKKSYSCKCGATKIELIPKTPEHDAFNSEAVEWKQFDGTYHKWECSCGEYSKYKEHTFDQHEVTKEPTHMLAGIMRHTCTDCGHYYEEVLPRLADAHTPAEAWTPCASNPDWHETVCVECGKAIKYQEHTWDNGTKIKEPTHMEYGTMKYSCTVCSFEKEEDIPRLLEHVFDDWKASEIHEDWHERVCECSERSTIYEEHQWDAGKITKKQTHGEDGEITYTCLVCNATKKDVVLKGHAFGYWESHNSEQHKKTCAECGDIIYADHSWDAGKVNTAPTHLAEGEILYACVECGETKIEILPKLSEHEWIISKLNEEKHEKTCVCGAKENEDHVWDDGKTVDEPTHISKGKMTYTCVKCGHEKEETVPAISEHTYGDWISHDENQHKRECECGNDLLYADHTWGEGEIITPATKDADGEIKYVCIDCGEEKIESLPKQERGGILSGCGAVLSAGGGLLLIASLSIAGVLLKKKKK